MITDWSFRRTWNLLHFQFLFAFLLSVNAARADEPIKGAFGQVLGGTFDPGTAMRTLSDSGFLAFWFPSPGELPILSQFSVIVSPLTYRIHSIVALGKTGSVEACLDTAKPLFLVISEKYAGEKYRARKHEAADGHAWSLTQPKPERWIEVKCDGTGELVVRYEDSAFRQAANEEQREFNQLSSDYAASRYDQILPRVRDLAEHGNLWSQTLLGLMYRKGQGVEHDDDKAEEYYKRAALQGWPNAQFNLGTYYKNQFRFNEAETWLLKAEAQDWFQAELNLGQLYLAKGLLHSEEKSFAWFLRAAQHGDKEAQYNTCYDNADGLGVTRDMVEAYRWCYIAAQNGQAAAARNRDHLAEQMQPSEVAQARAKAEQWLAHAGKKE